MLVVADESDRYVLIDGYCRVDALSSLGRDLVEIALLPVSAPAALILTWHMEKRRRRSFIEDA